MMYTYTVIIPHKNSPELLQRCLDSIPRRDDLQIIVVDDNSDPESVDFESFPGKNDPSTEVYFDKAGKGAGRARNVGLEHAKGKWLVFADADDYFYPGAFEIIDQKIQEENFDIIYFYCDSRNGKTGELIPDRVPTIKKGIDIMDYDLLRYESYVPWGKVISRNLILNHAIKFEEVEVSNDVMFSALVGYNSQRIAIISDALYCCTQNDGSLVFTPSIDRRKKRILAAIRVNTYLYNKGIRGYHVTIEDHIMSFFPNKPFLYFWAIYKGSYKDNTFNFYVEIGKRTLRVIKNRLKDYLYG